jgi:hypothetical protein
MKDGVIELDGTRAELIDALALASEFSPDVRLIDGRGFVVADANLYANLAQRWATMFRRPGKPRLANPSKSTLYQRRYREKQAMLAAPQASDAPMAEFAKRKAVEISGSFVKESDGEKQFPPLRHIGENTVHIESSSKTSAEEQAASNRRMGWA